MRSPRLKFFLLSLVILGLLFTLPAFLPAYYLYLSTEILVYSLFAVSVYLLLGGVGLLSFGQAAFFGIGAYTCALILKNTEHSFWIAILLGVGLATAAAWIIGMICVRRGKIYFAMLTLAFGQMIFVVIYKWYDLTGGEDGISGVAARPLNFLFARLDLANQTNYFFFTAVVAVASISILFLIMNSPFGLTLKSIRENQERVYFTGLNVRNIQTRAFTIAGFFAALAGTLLAPLTGQVSPDMAHWAKSAEPVIMILIGGGNHFAGPILGAAFYLFLGRLLHSFTEYWMLVWGCILAVIVLFSPDGVVGLLSNLVRSLRPARAGQAEAPELPAGKEMGPKER
jgi:branched-chain amino acid transport system permease protein